LGNLVREMSGGKAFAFLFAEIDGLKTIVGAISSQQPLQPV